MLRIGSISLPVPAVQAALSGYSDAAMRHASRRCGAVYAISEGLLDRALISGDNHKRVVELSDDDHPTAGQLLGSDPVELAEAANLLVGTGYDVVDVNFGCPVKKIMGRCRGGFLLGEPATALEIVRRVSDAVAGRVPVTLKMRRGLDDGAESTERFYRILDGALACGIAAFVVHGRTVDQLYEGTGRRSFIGAVKSHVGDRAAVIGSGDVFTGQDAMRMLAETGADGVSIARGAIGNPWIFAEFAALYQGRPLPPPPTLAEQAEMIAAHYSVAERLYRERAAVRMRKFADGYAQRHPQSAAVTAALRGLSLPGEVHRVLREWYGDCDAGGPDAPGLPAVAGARVGPDHL
jgi:nifR3 family TIM-barrel protein